MLKAFLNQADRWILPGLILWLLIFPSGATPIEIYAVAGATATSDGEVSQNGVPEHLPTENADRWGAITVAQPKIWQYERVNALLDGLLRDVEGVSLADLTQLNPNSQNAAAIKFIQSALGVSVQYDQAAAVNNSNILQNFKIQHDAQVEQFNQYNTYVDGLNAQRNQLTSQLFAANNTILTLQGQSGANGQLNPAQQQQLTEAQNRAAALQTQLTQVNSMITSAGSAPALTAPPTVQATSAPTPSPATFSNFGDMLKSLPTGLQNSLSSALQSPSYPATKQLDNFITLLHERLAREISVLQDDLMRDPDNLAFMLQFDVGLYPSNKTKNHMARVEFELPNCPGCKVYSLYPGQSSYNVANYQGASRRKNFAGSFASLIGLGISASYQRQEDTLRGSLVQSVYMSGFQDDTSQPPQRSQPSANKAPEQRFGWYYNAAPFDQYVTPGIRSTFAIITIPRKLIDCTQRPATNDGTPRADCAPFLTGASTQVISTDGKKGAHTLVAGTAGDAVESYAGHRACVATDNAEIVDPRKVAPDTKKPANHPELKTRLQTISNSDEPYPFCLLVTADWAERDNPFFQKPHWFNFSPRLGEKYLRGTHDSQTTRTLQVNLPGTENLIDFSAALNDKRRLHVLRMEYNTVTSKKLDATPSLATTTSPTPSPTPQPSAVAGQTYPQSNGCPKRECASILLSLDIPIDPNMVVTVHGTPLRRVRDWRGRATSVLPPAQSTSDLAPASSGAAQPKTQNPASRSLLETDQLEPDSWFAVTSHDLLLNISHHLAGEEEFPVIQISVPGKQTLVIPNDLQESITEVIIDGFRFLPSDQVQQHIRRIFGMSQDHSRQSRNLGGPFPFATFMPLFQPSPAAKAFFAFVGQTGEDLIVGFLKEPTDEAHGKRYSFLETRTLAILEDPDIDLAWPLPCEKQGEELVCHMPIAAIRRGYVDVVQTCEKDSCPSIEPRIQYLRESVNAWEERLTGEDSKNEPELAKLERAFVSGLQVWVEQYDPEGDNAFWSPEPAKIGLFPLSKDFTPPPPPPPLPGAPAPPSIIYKPWHFYGAHTESSSVAIEECNYFTDRSATIRYLTPLDLVETAKLTDQRVHDSGPRCGYITLPTSSLQSDGIVLQMWLDTLPGKTPEPSWTAAIPTAQLRPEFREVTVHPTVGKLGGATDGFGVTEWDISARMNRMYCTDYIEELEKSEKTKDGRTVIEDLQGPKTIGIKLQWLDGDQAASRNEPCPPTWWAAQQSGQIQVRLTISKSAARELPDTLHLVRDANGVKIRVGTLSYLRSRILPSKLTVEPIGDNQFALRGRNAGAIDSVALQSGTVARIYPAGSSFDLAVVDTTPSAAKTSVKPSGGTRKGAASQTPTNQGTSKGSGAPAPASPSPTSSPQPGAAKPSPALTEPNPPKLAAPTPTPKKKEGTASATKADPGLAPGTYALLPLICDEKGKNCVPVEVTDDHGKPLVFIKKAAAAQSPDKTPAKPDETITITKTTTKAAAPTPGAKATASAGTQPK